MEKLNVFKFLTLTFVVAGIMFLMAGCGDDPEKEHTHDWGEWQVTTAATCTEEGVETRTCETDGTSETRKIAVDLVNGHQWGEWEGTVTCTEGGTGTRTCKLNAAHSETNDNMPPLGHDYKWTEIPPTCTEAGSEKGVCANDPTHIDTRPGPAALGHDYQWKITIEPDNNNYGVGEETEVCTRDPSHTRDTRTIYWIRITPVTVTASTAGRGVTKVAHEGEEVTINLPIRAGWELTVFDKLPFLRPKEDILSQVTNNTYTFTMPSEMIGFDVRYDAIVYTISGTIGSVTGDGVVPYEVQILLKTDGYDYNLGFSRLYDGETAWSMDITPAYVYDVDITIGTELYFEIVALDNTGDLVGWKQKVKPVIFNNADMSNIDIGDVVIIRGVDWF